MEHFCPRSGWGTTQGLWKLTNTETWIRVRQMERSLGSIRRQTVKGKITWHSSWLALELLPATSSVLAKHEEASHGP